MNTILGKLKEGVDQVVTGAQVRIHEAQIRAQLRSIEHEKADQTGVLGRDVYTMHRAGNLQWEALDMQFQTLDAIETRLEAKQQEIDEFVARYGSALSGSVGSESSSSDHKCACGAELPPKARFCPECGKACS